MNSIEKQFNQCIDTILKDEYYYVVPQMVEFGVRMVNDILPKQTKFRNLTGNTITSFAFGVYYMGKLEVLGFNSKYPDPIRNKLIEGETVYKFLDYDGRIRKWFTADVNTDAGYGQNTSAEFLKSYVCTQKYGIVFTTGTEYSEYLQKVRRLNVLVDGYETARHDFVKSFKPIK
ncbi:hypothetical protein CLV62_12065 [Dysgonomonas alginatilytica]|uniref:Uncharacterized protein n=1 Tax=Dysgonomonas alginatilytica TaxID=1605892 RepID=A0A2V3PLY9_9BACT|nr:hypothetical protein [Dysgonomonas alginatilytica]PXV62376.1 hypothetical protein CLV62_12065 [Dysgonomonas alginatilytica]